MKCGMLIAVPTHAWAPAPTSTRSDRPLSSSGTKTISDSPPTRRRSITGEKIEPAFVEAGAARAAGDVDAAATGELAIDCWGGPVDRWTGLPVYRLFTSNVVSVRDGRRSLITSVTSVALGPYSLWDSFGPR